jgi:signal transduction histidine kinase
MRGFSHDVKNPLGAADGYAALLGDGIYGEITDEQRHSIDRIRQAIHRALSLIDDLHELARAETGHLAVRREPTNLADLVMTIGDEYRAAAEAKRLMLIIDAEGALPDVESDPSRIRQIVANLLSNAIKYTDRGSVVLRVRRETDGESDHLACIGIDVCDTGPGIPVDKTELIFEEFGRLPGETRAGTGLGLAISKRVADALGCRIELHSVLGAGSTFTLCIPIVAVRRPDDEQQAVAPAAEQRGPARVPSETPGSAWT